MWITNGGVANWCVFVSVCVYVCVYVFLCLCMCLCMRVCCAWIIHLFASVEMYILELSHLYVVGILCWPELILI